LLDTTSAAQKKEKTRKISKEHKEGTKVIL